MIVIIKCVHCDYVSYLAKNMGRCPQCGARTQELENPFKGESFVTKIQNSRRQMVDVAVTFDMMGEKINNIIATDKEKIVKDENTQNRILFFMQTYLWMLLKKSPSLWIHMDIVVSGLKELMTLKVRGS